jgi:hypothetical protein
MGYEIRATGHEYFRLLELHIIGTGERFNVRVGLDVGASYNGRVKCVELNVGSIGHRRFECKELISEALAMDIPRFLK